MKTDQGTVTVKFGEEPNVKEFSRAYTQKTYENADDVLNELQSPESLKTLLSNLNYGTDLKLRVKVRNEILAEQAGPEKSFNKLVADIIKNRAALGKPVTEEQARKMAEMIQGLDAEGSVAA
jgi:hypothetical protein